MSESNYLLCPCTEPYMYSGNHNHVFSDYCNQCYYLTLHFHYVVQVEVGVNMSICMEFRRDGKTDLSMGYVKGYIHLLGQSDTRRAR